jgi:hypothetical protein
MAPHAPPPITGRNTMPRTAPLRSARAAAALLGLALAAAALPAGARASGPGSEYGPEAEARFVVLCAEELGRSDAECRQASERLQSRLGYEAFLANAHHGPAGFDPAVVAFDASAAAPVVAAATTVRR